MAKILDIYERYKIMPQLQQHQLRVAAVAQQICDNFVGDIDADNIVTACLLHDMANIIKFDLSVFPEFSQPQGVDYWQAVKDEFLEKYQTKDEHPATLAIAREIDVSSRVLELIGAVGFVQGPANASSGDYGRKLCAYADMRVGPHGIISLEDRLNEAALRYTGQKFVESGARQDPFAKALRQIEKQISTHSKIKPADITDKSCAPIIERLKSYEIAR